MTEIACDRCHGTGVLSVLHETCHPMFNVAGLTLTADRKVWNGPCRGCGGKGYLGVPLRVPNHALRWPHKRKDND